GGKAKPLKQPKADKKDYDEVDMANIQKKKEEERRSRSLGPRHRKVHWWCWAEESGKK
ncbi:hypothetical protein CFP56_031464, partial [Quercus suber]